MLANDIIFHSGTSMLNPCTNSLADDTNPTVGTLKFIDTNWFAPYVNDKKCTIDKTRRNSAARQAGADRA